MTTPAEVVACIPTRALRRICSTDPRLGELDAAFAKMKIESEESNKENEANRPLRQAKNVAISYKTTATKTASKPEDKTTKPKKTKKELSGREASRRIVEEIERMAVRHLCQHHMPKALLVSAVDALDIDHGAMGNNGGSKSVAAKRLGEHIEELSGGLSTYLEKEATSDLVNHLIKTLIAEEDQERGLSRKSEKVEAVVRALHHEAMVTFFESLSENELHEICMAMKNESDEPETRSRSVLAASIINNQPVSELVSPGTSQKVNLKEKKKLLSKKKPKLVDGVTYDDVFQWYNLSELQEFARKHELKVSGKKKELIQRIIAFLANGSTDGTSKSSGNRRQQKSKASAKSSRSNSSSSSASTKSGGAAVHQFSKKISELLEVIMKGSKVVNKGLSHEEIDRHEKKIMKDNRSGMRFPPGLRQLYATCNGFSVHGDWTWGMNVYPLEDISSCKIDTTTIIGGDDLVKDWLEKRVKEGAKPEESIAHHSWLLLACSSEYDFLFINIDPSLEQYGAIGWCTNNCDSESEHCGSMEELLEKTAKYVKARERARKQYAEEEPDASEGTLEDYVIDQINYDDDEQEEEEEEEEDKEGSEDEEDDGDE